MLWKNIFWVAMGGSIGSVARYLAHRFISSNTPVVFPYGTLLVNITGCLLIGIFFGVSMRIENFGSEWKLLLMTGLCGGFTTFSAFTLEGMQLIQQQRGMLFVLYFSLSVFAGLLATFLGYWLTR